MPVAAKKENVETKKVNFLDKLKAITKRNKKGEKIDRITFWGRTGFIISLVTILLLGAQIFIFPVAIFLTIPLAIVGIVFSAIGLRAKKVGMSVSGLTISIVTLNLAIVTGLYVLIVTMLSGGAV